MPRDPIIEYERKLHRTWAGYTYYDTPDGEDLFSKLLYTGKIAFCAGGIWGLSNAYGVHPIPTNNLERLDRVLRRVLPAVGIASAFTITTFYATRLRKKDDELNYILGGIAAGCTLGAIMGRPFTGFYSSLLFGAVGYTKKNFELRGSKVMKTVRNPKTLSSYYLRKCDTSILPDNIRGNWSRTPPEAE